MRDIACMGLIGLMVSSLSACTHTGELKETKYNVDKHVVSIAPIKNLRVKKGEGLAPKSQKKNISLSKRASKVSPHFVAKQRYNQRHKYTILYSEEGSASYYNSALHGRKTASGERYNKNNLTAAHRKLPFGTRVRVLNQGNGRSIWVTVNDRGPFAKGRVLDLSYQAAEQLDMIRIGIAPVKIEVIQ